MKFKIPLEFLELSNITPLTSVLDYSNIGKAKFLCIIWPE